MTRVMIALAFMLVTSPALSSAAVTKDGHVACSTKQWYENMISFSIAEDMESIQSYVDMRRCVLLKEGLRVTVTDSPGMFGSKVGFTYRGFEFWTNREALDYNP